MNALTESCKIQFLVFTASSKKNHHVIYVAVAFLPSFFYNKNKALISRKAAPCVDVMTSCYVKSMGFSGLILIDLKSTHPLIELKGTYYEHFTCSFVSDGLKFSNMSLAVWI